MKKRNTQNEAYRLTRAGFEQSHDRLHPWVYPLVEGETRYFTDESALVWLDHIEGLIAAAANKAAADMREKCAAVVFEDFGLGWHYNMQKRLAREISETSL